MTKNNDKDLASVVNISDGVDERMVPSKHKGSSIYGEHIARYEAAQDIVKDKIVLDIACGSGYGTSLLSKYAKRITGVDISNDAVNFANKEYCGDNIIFKKSNGKTIPFEDDSFDVVTSFETIEHINEYEFFMAEIKRVLKPNGLFILSTPNKLEFSQGNHFHVHEFIHDELVGLVKKYYSELKPFYQSTWVGNLIGTKQDMIQDWKSIALVHQIEPIEEKKFLYFYFLCSNRPIEETISTRYTISQHYSENKDNQLTLNHIKNLEEIVKSDKEELRRLEGELNLMKTSKTWKIRNKIVKMKNQFKNI